MGVVPDRLALSLWERVRAGKEPWFMGLRDEVLKEMYVTMRLARRLDERAWILHRQGKIAFHISGIGHGAAQVGAAFALDRGARLGCPLLS
jgi:2-oxoisovalerate dehydrogenase E1 component alpha subunit